MIDTRENIDKSVEEMHEFLDSIELSEEERKKMDLSYLDDEE